MIAHPLFRPRPFLALIILAAALLLAPFSMPAEAAPAYPVHHGAAATDHHHDGGASVHESCPSIVCCFFAPAPWGTVPCPGPVYALSASVFPLLPGVALPIAIPPPRPLS